MKSGKRNEFADEAFETAVNRTRVEISPDFTKGVMQAVAEKEKDASSTQIYQMYQRRLSWAAAAAGFMLILNLSVIGFITTDSNAEQQPQEISEALFDYLEYGNENTIDWTELTND